MKRRWKLQSLLTILMVLTAVVPVVVAAAIGRLFLESDSVRHGSDRAKWGAYLLSQLAEDRLLSTEAIVEEAARRYQSSPIKDDHSVLEFCANADRKIRALFVLDRNLVTTSTVFAPSMHLSEEDFVGIDLSGNAAVQKAVETGKPCWSNATLTPLDGKPIVSFVMPVKDRVIMAQVELTSFEEVATIMDRFPELKASIVDSSGTVIYDSDESRSLQRVNGWNSNAVKAALSDRSGSLIEPVDDVESIVGYAPIPSIGWAIIVRRPKTEVLVAATATQTVLMITALLSALAAAIAAVLMSRWLMKPLSRLILATSEIAEGKPSVHLPEMGTEEILRLSDSVQLMAHSIRQREQYLIQVNSALQKSEERYRSFVETAQEGIIAIDRDGVTVYVNPAAGRVLGYETHEMVGQPIVDYIAEDERESHYDCMRVRRQLIEQTYERKFIAKSGAIIYLFVSATPIVGEDGQYNGAFATLIDITDRKESELARASFEVERQILVERLQQQFDAMPVAIISLDNQLRVTDWNPAAESTFGIEKVEAMGRIPSDWLVTSSQLHSFIEWLKSPATDIQSMQFQSPKSRHQVVLCEWTKSRLIDSHGAIVGVLAIAQDVTAKVEAEQTIQTLNLELERRIDERTHQLAQANKELESFSYSVSHDLRAPLRAIDGFASIIVEDYGTDLGDEVKQYLDRIRLNATRMGTLIDDLLTLSRLSRHDLDKTIVYVKDIVDEILQEVHQDIKDRDLLIHVDDNLSLLADPILMKQVYANLISNAIKYTSHNSTTLIDIGAKIRHGKYTYFVKDNGVGFDNRYADKVFEVFQRAHRQDEYEGTGIGLAIVQRIIRRHGGSVWADTGIGKGTTIFFSIPDS